MVLSPKVATTYIRDILSMAHMEVTGAFDPSEGRLGLLKRARRMPVAPLADYRHFLAHPSDYRIFGIVRDPYRRLSSAWRNKFLDPFEKFGGDVSKYPRSMREGELKKVQDFARGAGLEGQTPDRPVPFSTFMDFVAYQRPGRRNHHWEDQWRILFHDDLPYTQVFRMEDGLEAPLRAVLEPIGLTPEWVEARTARPSGQKRANQSSRAEGGDFTRRARRPGGGDICRGFQALRL